MNSSNAIKIISSRSKQLNIMKITAKKTALLSDTAEEKQRKLFKLVTHDKTSGQFPKVGLDILRWFFYQDRSYVMDHDSDVRPPSAGDKRIHSIGSTATAKYESIGNHSYTGIFQQGSPHAMVRLSLAKASDDDQTSPGIAVKFFRNGMKSANFMAMYRLEGQKGPHKSNFFLNDFSNHVLPPTKVGLKLLGDQFEKVAPSTMVGLSDIATEYTSTGKEVVSSDVKVPYKLILRPDIGLKEEMNVIIGKEPDSTLTDHLSHINSDATLYEVYALETPKSEAEHIGRLSLTEKLTSSRFGDNELFFQHQSMDDDWKIHSKLNPEWKEDYDVWKKDFEREHPVIRCPFANLHKPSPVDIMKVVSQPFSKGLIFFSSLIS